MQFTRIIDGTVIESKHIEELSFEARVAHVIINAHKRVTIAGIVNSVVDLGGHEKHEHPKIRKTTTRKVYQVVRNLREAGVPIVGDTKGLWIAESLDEIRTFADRIERKAKSDIASMTRLHDSMIDMLPEERKSLFDSL